MSFEEIIEIINAEWLSQSEYATSFLEVVHLPYEIFKANREKLREINYIFDPNIYNDVEGYYVVFIKCSNISKISFEYN